MAITTRKRYSKGKRVDMRQGGRVRLKKGGRVPSPGPGYGNPSIIKHLHPSGYEEVYVSCSKDMAEIDAKTQAIRFNGTLGKKKKEVLLKDAEKAGIKVLNP